MSNVLIVAAHPDDEVLGCGIAIQHHKQRKDNVHVLIMTFGAKLRYQDEAEKHLIKDIKQANKEILNVDSVAWHQFPDQGLDTIKLTDLIIPIEKYVNHYQIDIVYTHHYGDINKDHRLVYEATITACRPTPSCWVKKLLSYWVPSSSEWMRYDENNAFKPNFIIKANKEQLDIKINALSAYASEVRHWPHPRSFEGIRTYAKIFGSQFGMDLAEPFQLLYDRSS